MNRENILKVADAIEKHSIPDLGFNMTMWIDRHPFPGQDISGHNCGTTACIAGWAAAVSIGASEAENLNTVSVSVRRVARDYLGLSDDEALWLFEGFSTGEEKPSQAVSVLRHLAETGKVDWERALHSTEGERK